MQSDYRWTRNWETEPGGQRHRGGEPGDESRFWGPRERTEVTRRKARRCWTTTRVDDEGCREDEEDRVGRQQGGRKAEREEVWTGGTSCEACVERDRRERCEGDVERTRAGGVEGEGGSEGERGRKSGRSRPTASLARRDGDGGRAPRERACAQTSIHASNRLNAAPLPPLPAAAPAPHAAPAPGRAIQIMCPPKLSVDAWRGTSHPYVGMSSSRTASSRGTAAPAPMLGSMRMTPVALVGLDCACACCC